MAPLTGRKVLAICVAFFGVIIAVNLVMAFKAVDTFPGLEVDSGNGYVESQSFDKDRDAQIALGWAVRLDYDAKELTVAFEGKDGKMPEVATLDVLVGRPTEARDDRTPAFTRSGPVFRAPVALGPGKWMVRVDATAKDGTLFHQRLALYVKG